MRGKPKAVLWPQQWHGPGGESAWFNEPMYIPRDWTPYVQLHPEIVKIVPKVLPDRTDLKAALVKNGIKVDPRWSAAKMVELLKDI